MMYAETQEGLVHEIMCMTFRWKGDYCAWVLPALAHISLANKPWHISAAVWLETEALEWIETKKKIESSEDLVNALGW